MSNNGNVCKHSVKIKGTSHLVMYVNRGEGPQHFGCSRRCITNINIANTARTSRFHNIGLGVMFAFFVGLFERWGRVVCHKTWH